MDSVKTFRANRKLQGKPCAWCRAPLALGEDVAVCTACEVEHHQRCWEDKAGCSTGGCASAPLDQLAALPIGSAAEMAGLAAAAPSITRCPTCHTTISIHDRLCPFCGGVNSPDGIYHGPRINAPGAVASMVLGIVGLFFCGVIFGPVAISKANAARRAIAEDPTYGGGGFATAGTVLGIIDLVGWALVLFMRLGAGAG
jgi:hypothetical protein